MKLARSTRPSHPEKRASKRDAGTPSRFPASRDSLPCSQVAVVSGGGTLSTSASPLPPAASHALMVQEKFYFKS